MTNLMEHAERSWKKALTNSLPHHIPTSWWSSFPTFLRDVGLPPTQKHYLRRLKVRQPFSYINCRWIDPEKGKGEHLIGKRFGKLVVKDALIEGRYQMVIAKCDCGSFTKTRYSSVIRGATTSCDCVHLKAVTKHGAIYTPTWNVWRNMRLKCFNKSSKSYVNFGGIGISICERWNDYRNFVADMGEKPSKEKGSFLNRHDKNGNFTPENCFWSKKMDWDR